MMTEQPRREYPVTGDAMPGAEPPQPVQPPPEKDLPNADQRNPPARE